MGLLLMTLDETVPIPVRTWADDQITPEDLHEDAHPFDTIDTAVFVGAVVKVKS